MKQHNALIAGVSLASACAAVAVGALVSNGAMASSDGTDKATVGVISVGDGSGEPISCSFDDLQLPGMPGAPTLTPGQNPSGADVQVITGHATIVEADGSLPELELPEGVTPESAPPGGVLVATATATVGGEGSVTVGGEGSGAPGELDALFTADARPGTAEECAAIRADLERVAP